MIKTCSRHGETDHVKNVDSRRGTTRWRCKKCRNNRVKNAQRKRKVELIELLGGKCQLCGYNKSVWSLDFHHRDKSQKLFQISRYYGRSKELLKNEAEKCDLLCRNCHAEVEEIEFLNAKSGTPTQFNTVSHS